MNVEELLQREDIVYQLKGKDFLIRCINPDHPDNNPSMRVDRVTGVYNCFSCKFKGNIFNFFEEELDWINTKREFLKQKIKEKLIQTVGLELPKTALPYRGDWRNISSVSYKHFEAFECSDTDFNGRIVFPIKNIENKIVALIGRHTTGGTPKYLIRPHEAKIPLYPHIFQERVILVEGIFDVLNLYDKGLTNVTACFGTNNVNKEKLSILKMQGVKALDIFFDGDEAGQEGAKKVKKLCEKIGLLSRNIYIEGQDPGQLTQKQVLKLQEKL